MSYRPVEPIDGDQRARTDMHCHQCSRSFIAELDFGIDGEHVIECPHCGHEHCRNIKAGLITDKRWSSRPDRILVEPRCVWKSDVLQAKTSTASRFIRDAWLNRSGLTP